MPVFIAFLLRWWKGLALIAVLVAAFIAAQVVINNAYDRGYKKAQGECEVARLKAEEAVRAKLAQVQEEGRVAGITEGQRLSDEAAKGRETTKTVIRRIAGPIQKVTIHDCPLNMDAAKEIVSIINERRSQINEAIQK